MHCRRAKCDHYHIVFVTHRKPRSDHLKANFIEDLNLAVETQKINKKKTTFKRFFKAEVHRTERITPFSREIHILPILFGGVEGLDLMSKEGKKNQLCKRDLQCMGRFETFIKKFPEWYLSIKHRIEHPDCFEKSDWKTFSPEPEINLTAERQLSKVEETDLMSDDETLPNTEDPLNPPKEHPYAPFYQLFRKYGPIPIQEARKTFSLEDLTKIIPNASEKMYEKAREKYIYDIIQKYPFEDFYELLSNKDDADDTKFEPKDFTYTFLNSLFERQKFSEDKTCRFCHDLYSILEKTSGKVNALFLWGPTSSGKSMLTDLVRKVMVLDAEYIPGRSFNFSSCTSATLIVFEDVSSLPTTSMPTLKCLFEGRPTPVPVKHKSPQKIERTPMIITSNFELKKLFDKELNKTNLDAFEKRIIQYQFPTTWDSNGIQPSVNPKHFLEWLKENKNKYTTSSEAHSQRRSQAYMDQSGYINPADEQH